MKKGLNQIGAHYLYGLTRAWVAAWDFSFRVRVLAGVCSVQALAEDVLGLTQPCKAGVEAPVELAQELKTR
ncbi:MAG: hypothetical protein JXB85_03865 [Anaerolineales bacterium]|nr:hypothetical protein [Anaerolineales bacterium]